MKTFVPVIVLAAAALVGFLWWLLPSKPETFLGDDNAPQAAEQGAPAAATEPPEPWLPADRVDSHERARLLAAIAAGVARAGRDAGDSPDRAQAIAPRGAQARRLLRAFSKNTQRRLMPVVRDCLREVMQARPELASPHNRAVITLQGAGPAGSLATGVELKGPEGDLDARPLRRCIERQVNSFRFEATPDLGDGSAEAQTSVFTIPLLVPDDGPALPQASDNATAPIPDPAAPPSP